MNVIELQRALRQLRLGGVAAVLETRLRQAQTEAMAPIDLIACPALEQSLAAPGQLVSDLRGLAVHPAPDALSAYAYGGGLSKARLDR
jgi:hypothetical protein